MSLTESIKEELDRECEYWPLANKVAENLADVEQRLAQAECICDCWRCHKHDALAARIATRLKDEERT